MSDKEKKLLAEFRLRMPWDHSWLPATKSDILAKRDSKTRRISPWNKWTPTVQSLLSPCQHSPVILRVMLAARQLCNCFIASRCVELFSGSQNTLPNSKVYERGSVCSKCLKWSWTWRSSSRESQVLPPFVYSSFYLLHDAGFFVPEEKMCVCVCRQKPSLKVASTRT